MLNTFIKNRGSTKTIIHDNNKNKVNVMEWDADYDGNEANVSLDLINNGKTKHYNIKLDNKDLANILSIASVKKPIHKRLESDFKKARFDIDPSVYSIYLDDFKAPSLIPPTYENNLIAKYNPTVSLEEEEEETSPLDELLQMAKPNTHISSPLIDEELIIPLTIDKDTETPSKHPYKTYRVFKRDNNVGKGFKTKRKTHRKNKSKKQRVKSKSKK